MLNRLIYLFVLLAGALLFGLGAYFQYGLHLQPCGPQVLVRYALVFAGLFALIALIAGSAKIVRVVMSAGIALASLAGAVVAAHQSWPHHVPLHFAHPDSLARSLPLGDALPKLFMGSGECDKHWSIIGISGSEWALIAFIAFIVAAFFAARGK
ncbi:MAG TPA: disulfide bond formation protein B [Burkholderiales bacterium]|nr:disulfide bond formation protein B [Burkholderiales bacterium]